jgi:hypothetical protein
VQSRWGIAYASIAACISYLAVIAALRQLDLGLLTIFIPAISIPLFSHLVRGIPDSKIEKKEELGPRAMSVRALIGAAVILAITEIAELVGPQWAGLLSAFPTTLFPLILIIHSTYGEGHTHTIIKNVPKGQWAMVVYVLAVFFLYPAFGVYIGTLVSYSLVLAYLAVIFIALKK